MKELNLVGKKLVVSDLLCDEMTSQVMFAREEFGLNSKFDPELILGFKKGNPCGGTSLGGIPTIWFPVGRWYSKVCTPEHILFEEYSAFENHPKIGSIKIQWEGLFAVILAHELSHCMTLHPATLKKVIQRVPKKYQDDTRQHGLLWQYVYSKMRAPVVRRYKKQIASVA